MIWLIITVGYQSFIMKVEQEYFSITHLNGLVKLLVKGIRQGQVVVTDFEEPWQLGKSLERRFQ